MSKHILKDYSDNGSGAAVKRKPEHEQRAGDDELKEVLDERNSAGP